MESSEYSCYICDGHFFGIKELHICYPMKEKYVATIKSLKEALETISPLKLRALATWLDVKFPDDKDDEVQKDLRLMAKRSFEALAQADEVLKEGK